MISDDKKIMEIYEKLMEAEGDIQEGRVMDGEESLRKLKQKYGLEK